MKLLKEHCEEFHHTKALDNVPKLSVKGNGTKAWVHIAQQSLDTKNYTLLYWVRRSIHALELKCATLKRMKKRTRINRS